MCKISKCLMHSFKVLLPDKPYCNTIVASRVYFTRLCTLSVSKIGGQNLKTVFMQNA